MHSRCDNIGKRSECVSIHKNNIYAKTCVLYRKHWHNIFSVKNTVLSTFAVTEPINKRKINVDVLSICIL